MNSDIHNHALKRTLVLLVPDGIGVRNYLYSDIIRQIDDKSIQIVLLHRLANEVVEEIQAAYGGNIIPIALPDLQESRYTDTLRRICMFARLHLNATILHNKTIGENWFFFSVLKGRKRIWFRMLNAFAGVIATIPGLALFIEKHLFYVMRKSHAGSICRKIILDISPSMILCTHQRSIEAGYVMEVAKELRVETAGVIFSWDNLPKSRMTFRANLWLVWSQWMKDELLKLYPSINAQQVAITGTPQFDIYHKSSFVWSRDAFNTHFGLPTNKTVICFAGNEPNFPGNHFYLKDVLESIKKNKMLSNTVVLIRPSPNDFSGKLDSVAAEYPDIAVMARPLWKKMGNRDWESYIPLPEDNIILLNLVQHCQCLINMGSTMTLDFAHGNKPSINIAYNHPDCADFDFAYGYKQQHMKTMDGLDATVFVASRNELPVALQLVIEKPQDYAKDRLKWKRLITDDIYPASDNIANLLNTYLSKIS